jgi:hypothetical protein
VSSDSIPDELPAMEAQPEQSRDTTHMRTNLGNDIDHSLVPVSWRA